MAPKKSERTEQSAMQSPNKNFALAKHRSADNLIQKALKGDEEAFIQLYRDHVNALFGFIFTKVNNVSDTEDLTSETFYQALKDLKKYSFKSSFKNWLYGIAKHLILAFYREKYTKETLELNENSAFHRVAQGLDPKEEEQKFKKNSETLKAIFTELPSNYRNILELRFLKGYSILESAEALGISEENAKVLQHRAIKKANQVVTQKPTHLK